MTASWCRETTFGSANRYAMTPRYENSPISASAAIDLMDVLRGVGRRKILILGVGVLAFAAAMGIVTTLTPVYTSQTKVLIQNLETPFDRVQPAENQRADAIDDRIVASQMSVLRSEDLGRRVIAALGLETNPEFNALIRGQGTLAKLKVKLGFGSDPARKTPEERALDRYVDNLNVFQLPDSNVVGIQYNSTDPATAGAVANTLADIYVMWTRESQSQPTERAREWLSQQIDGLRKRLAQSEEAAERFRTKAGLLKGATATLGEQEISELNSQITVARSASLDARAKSNSIRAILRAKGSVDSATDVLNSGSVQRLKEQRTEAMRRKAELSVTYLSNHPKLIAAGSEISNIDKQILSEALKIVASLDEQARIAESRQASLTASLGSLKNQESAANLDDVKLQALERDSAADRALLEAMLSRYAEASARQDLSSQPGLAVIIQNASVPTSPSFPKSGPMVLLITIMGFSFGIGLAFLLELMAAANRLNVNSFMPAERKGPAFAAAEKGLLAPRSVTAAELPNLPGLRSAAPPPVWVPSAAGMADVRHLTVWPGIVPQDGMPGITVHPEVSAAARNMAHWVEAIHSDLNAKRIGIASLGGGPADACVAALAVARHLAISGKRVVLVDLARTESFLGDLCGVPAGPGVADLAGGSADFTKVISRDTRSPLHVLRFGQDRSPGAAVLILERIEGVLVALSQAYDIVMVNLGEAGEDTPVYLHKCQGALLMSPAARLDEATSAVQTLLDTGLSAARHMLIAEAVAAAADSPEAVTA